MFSRSVILKTENFVKWLSFTKFTYDLLRQYQVETIYLQLEKCWILEFFPKYIKQNIKTWKHIFFKLIQSNFTFLPHQPNWNCIMNMNLFSFHSRTKIWLHSYFLWNFSKNLKMNLNPSLIDWDSLILALNSFYSKLNSFSIFVTYQIFFPVKLISRKKVNFILWG